MNEIIRKCFIDAGGAIVIDDVTQDEWTFTENLDVEKFAKLIVQESILSIQMDMTRGKKDDIFNGQIKAVESIEKYFG